MKKKELKKETTKYIVKSNSLVEARYRLSLQESHVVFWLLTQIRPDDEDFKPHTMEIAQFSKMIGVEVDNQYSKLRLVTKSLMRRVLEIYDSEKETYTQVAWLSSARYEAKKGTVSLEFSPHLKPYLLQLKSHFTKIDIVDTLKLKSVHAIRIFELLLQYFNIGKRTITIEELRQYCGIAKHEYQDYFDLKRKVIEKAKTEINAKTDYDIDYEQIKESRKIIAIEWSIKKKNPQSEKVQIIQKEYRSELALIDSLVEYGFSKKIAKRFITNNGEEIVRNAMKSVDLQIERGQVKNPKAMLQVAINERWHPEVFKKVKKRAC